MSSIADRALKWTVSGNTGSSSLAILSVMTGNKPEDGGHSYPLDGGDLGRCLALLAAVPEWRTRLGEMRVLSRQWAALVDHWDELAALHAKNGKVYERMQAILRPIEEKDPGIIRLGQNVTMRFRP